MTRQEIEEAFERGRAAYLKDPYRCPVCNGKVIIPDELTWGEASALGYVHCADCRAQWTEFYTLTNIELEEE